MKLTKSKYVEFCMCPRKAWLNLFDPIAAPKETKRGAEGTRIGKLATNYFGEGICVEADRKNPSTDIGLYAEYPLRFGELECYIDMFRINNDNTVDIFEVKSVNQYSNHSESHTAEEDEEETESFEKLKKVYLEDVSFQYYVAIKRGLKVNSVNLIAMNRDYVYDGITLDLKQLFKVIDVTNQVSTRLDIVEENINKYQNLSKDSEVKCPFSGFCNKYEGCQYLEVCKKSKNLPETNSVYDLYMYSPKTKMIEEGILTFADIINTPYFEKMGAFNQRMVTFKLLGITDTYVNKELLDSFLKKFKTKVLFFDFETVQQTVPEYPNSRPYQQIPFQYSLHTMEDLNTPYKDVVDPSNNLYFLGDGTNDPREELIKKMLKDLGTKGKIVAYNKKFEMDRITELARDFPKYSKKLEALLTRFVDLRDVFLCKEKIGYRDKKETPLNRTTSMVYHPLMGNSTSIKYVLPAFFGNDPDLDYTKLEQVHKGDEASESYKELSKLSPEDRDILRKNMLKYCSLDTKAMVALFYKIREINESIK